MIKLTRSSKPSELTEELERQLVDVFKKEKTSVWNKDFIKIPLRAFSFDKCCYCEININEESKYMEIDHYLPKVDFPDKVVDWENLLPACKRCNGKKGEHQTHIEPIIEPTKDNPKMHLGFWCYRIRAKDKLGEVTIDVLDLNNTERLCKKRFDIGNGALFLLDEIYTLAKSLDPSSTTRTKNSIVRQLKTLLNEGQITKEYCSTIATIILNSDEYQKTKSILQALTLWDREFTDLEQGLQMVQFDIIK